MTAIRAALVTPLTGPLAVYGRAGLTALGLLGDFDLSVHDAHPDPAAAMAGAVAGRPDVIFGPYGSSPALAAIGATERPVWNHGGSTSVLRRPRYGNAVNVLAPASTYFDGALRALRAAEPPLASVVLVRANTGFAGDVGSGANAGAAACGFQVAEVVFEPGQATEAAGRVPEGEVLLVVGGFEDELALARALLGRGWAAAVFVGAGTDEVLTELGEARQGLLGPAQWLASAAPAEPQDGPDTDWFVDAYHKVAGSDPPYPAAQALAAGILAARGWKEAGPAGDAGLLAAAGRLDTTTLYGRFRLDPATGLQVGHEVLTVQWQDGARHVIWPPERATHRLVLQGR